MKCHCEEWRNNIGLVNGPGMLQAFRSCTKGYTGVCFRFCPWCSTLLVEDNVEKPAVPESRERIYSSALRLKDGRIVYCHRHGDGFKNVTLLGDECGFHADADQGFMTTGGRFVDRQEAAKIATAAGQLIVAELKRRGSPIPPHTLYSEDVW
jgi:hypothetical protein